MLVSERVRERYDYDRDYNRSANSDRYARYDCVESGYETYRDRTSDSYRDSLRSSLERPATHSRLERSDDDRYGFYRSNIEARENNYDKLWDSKQKAEPEKAPVQRKKVAFIAVYLFIALVAIIAVTLSVIGTSEQPTVAKKTISIETMSATAEISTGDVSVSAATDEIQEEAPILGGETYIRLKNGELVAVKVPEQVKTAKEEEKGFDKFCSWLNGVFGG